MSESGCALMEIESLKESFAEYGQPGQDREPEDEQGEPELSEREMAFISQCVTLMDRYCKPIANISFPPLKQAVFSVGGRYSALVLPSPLRAVRILGKMAVYSAYLQKKGRP